MDGWLKLYRELMKKPLWTETTAEQKVLLIALLMRAAYNSRTWVFRGIVYHLKPGQLVTSINSLVEMGGLGVTHRKVRTALGVFEKYGFMTQQATKHNTIITIENWESYQKEAVQPTQKVSQQRHSSDTTASHAATSIKKLRSEEGVDGEEGGVITPPPPPPKKPSHQQVVAQFNLICTDLPKVRKLTDERRKAIDASWLCLVQLLPGTSADEAFQLLFKAVQGSDFLKGDNGMRWRADFDWLMTRERVQRVMEEKYEGVHQQPLMKPNAELMQSSSHFRTGFHLSESRGERYSNDQLEAILLGKKKKRSGVAAEEGGAHGHRNEG